MKNIVKSLNTKYIDVSKNIIKLNESPELSNNNSTVVFETNSDSNNNNEEVIFTNNNNSGENISKFIEGKKIVRVDIDDHELSGRI